MFSESRIRTWEVLSKGHTLVTTRAKWPKSRLNRNMSKLCFLVSLLKWPYWTVLGHCVLKCFVCCAGKSWGRSAHAALKRFGCWDPHRSSPKNMTHMTWKQEKRGVKKNVKRCKDWIEQTSGFNFHHKILTIPHHKQRKQQIHLIYRNCGCHCVGSAIVLCLWLSHCSHKVLTTCVCVCVVTCQVTMISLSLDVTISAWIQTLKAKKRRHGRGW